MKEIIKTITKKLGLYHLLQSNYRNVIQSTAMVYYRIAYAKYKGEGFTCNVCSAEYKKFIPEYPSALAAPVLKKLHVIAGYGVNVYCPSCFSKNRDRLLIAYFSETGIVSKKNVLHFSPEKAITKYLNKVNAAVTAVDLHPGFYKAIAKEITRADATNLQFEDYHFDVIIANHILEHIPNDKDAIAQMYRVLKPGGLAILQIPFSLLLNDTIEDRYINDAVQQEKLYGQADHVRIYAKEDFEERLSHAGFETLTVEKEQLKNYAKFAIQNEEVIFLVRKKQKME